jgi:hypothetical protein
VVGAIATALLADYTGKEISGIMEQRPPEQNESGAGGIAIMSEVIL